MPESSKTQAKRRDRLAAQLEKVAKLRAEVRADEQRENKRQRAAYTRRLVLLGVALQGDLDAGIITQQRVDEMLRRHLTRPAERAIFDLDRPAPTLPSSS